MPPAHPPPALPLELLEEIFLRLLPDEPACLVRASLASKLWLGLLRGPGFRGRYRELHGAPPMLGFIYSAPWRRVPEEDDNLKRFVATTKFGVHIAGTKDMRLRGWDKYYTAWDCRHGRVLFSNNGTTPMQLVVWDPMTGRRRMLYAPEDYDDTGAAVLCNVTGCDHRSCHLGPFQVVFVGLNNRDGGSVVAYAHLSLPEVGGWSKPCSLDLGSEDASFVGRPPVFIQDAFYFMLTDAYYYEEDADNVVILKYDLGSNCLSLIHAPPVEIRQAYDTVLMAMKDGSLGFAHVAGLTLNLWSRHIGSSGVAPWTWRWRKIIDLETLLPIQNHKENLRLIGSVEGRDIIFVTTDLGLYEINLNSLRWKKIWRRQKLCALFPYMSFYNPPESVSSCDAVN